MTAGAPAMAAVPGQGSRECCSFGDKGVPFPPWRSSSDQQWTGLDSNGAPKGVREPESSVAPELCVPVDESIRSTETSRKRLSLPMALML